MRGALLLAGLGLLALAALLRPPAPAAEGTLGAVGRSMGGARVLVIDGLFLRAETLRSAGRIEEAAALYRAVLDIDPANEAATVFLVDTIVDELMPQGLDADERFAWWREARLLLVRALGPHPRSAVLHHRLATLILDLSLAHADLAARLAGELGRPQRVALGHLQAAFQEADVLPRAGRSHLVRAALLAPDVAAAALARGDAEGVRVGLAVADELQRLRVASLRALTIEGSASTLADVLAAGSAAVRAAEAVERGTGDAARARERIAQYERLLADRRLPGHLRAVLARSR